MDGNDLSFLTLLNNIKANLANQLNQSRKSKVVLQPRIAERHVSPKLGISIFISIIMGIVFSFTRLYMERIKNERRQPN